MPVLSCKKCPIYTVCTEMCPDATLYVNQDSVDWDGDDNLQITSDEHLDNIAFKNSQVGESVTPTKEFLIAREYYVFKRSLREIADLYDENHVRVWRIIKRVERKIKNKV